MKFNVKHGMRGCGAVSKSFIIYYKSTSFNVLIRKKNVGMQLLVAEGAAHARASCVQDAVGYYLDALDHRN